MGTINGNQFKSSYLGDQIDALLAAMAQANPLPSGTDWVAFIDDCRDAQSGAESAAVSSEEAAAAASGYADNAAVKATEAAGSALSASGSASSAASGATLSQSWAVGGTGTRSGENTNNAKYWSQQAQHAAGGGVTSFNNRSGVVLPQSGDYASFYTPIVGKGKQLLDNAYLIGGGTGEYGKFPVNQKRNANYTAVGICVDRWRLLSANLTVAVNSDGVKLTAGANAGSIGQVLRDTNWWLGKTVTLSMLYNGTKLVTKTITIPATRPSASGAVLLQAFESIGSIQIYYDVAPEDAFRVYLVAFANKSYTINAAKLELGDTQTLARQVNSAWVLNDTPPDFQAELNKCKAYQLVWKNTSTMVKIIGYGRTGGATVGRIKIPTGVCMNKKPTMYSFGLNSYTSGDCSLVVNGNQYPVTSFASGPWENDVDGFYLFPNVASGSNMQTNAVAILQVNTGASVVADAY